VALSFASSFISTEYGFVVVSLYASNSISLLVVPNYAAAYVTTIERNASDLIAMF